MKISEVTCKGNANVMNVLNKNVIECRSFDSRPFQRPSQEDIEILDSVDHIMPDSPADAQVQDIPLSKSRQTRTNMIKHIVGEAQVKV